MAEPDGDFQEGATTQETPTEEVQPKEFTPEELRDILMGELRPEFNAFYRGVQSRMDHLESQLKELPEVLTMVRQAQTYAKRVATSTLTPEDIQAMEQAEQTETLRKQLEDAKAERATWQDVAVKTIKQQDETAFEAVAARLKAYGKSQGLASIEHLPFPSARDVYVAMPTDPRGWHGWEEAAKEVIDAEVERLARAAQPQATIDTRRPAGDTGDRLQNLVNKAGAGEDLSPAEIAQVAKALNEGYVVKRR